MPGAPDLLVSVVLRFLDQTPALVERSGALLFRAPVAFGARLTNGRFVLGEPCLITLTCRARLVGRAFGQGLPLVQDSAYGSEQDSVQHKNEDEEEDKYENERAVRAYDVAAAFGEG